MTAQSVPPRSRGRKGVKVSSDAITQNPAAKAAAPAPAPWVPKIVDLEETGKRKKPVDKLAEFNDWQTPRSILDPIHELAGGQIGLDPATAPDNPSRAKTFFTKEDDGLSRSWKDHGLVFLNPPYGRVVQDGRKLNDFLWWTEKVRREAREGVPIVTLYSNARKETKAWQQTVFCNGITAMTYVKGRVEFVIPPAQVEARRRAGKKKPEGGGNANSNELYFYNIDYDLILPIFMRVGLTVKITDFAHFGGGEWQEDAGW